jgi:hypothetical protein
MCIRERIPEKRQGNDSGWDDHYGDVEDVDITKYGVTEHIGWNSDLETHDSHCEYGLQEYVDRFEELLLGDKERLASLPRVRLKFDHPHACREWVAEPCEDPGFVRITSLSWTGEPANSLEMIVHETEVEFV